MRVIVLFDLPSISLDEKREYRKFRKYLLRMGFIMVQESVYSKLVLNGTVAKGMLSNIKRNKPSTGLVQVLVITESQYSKMVFIVGEKKNDVIDSDERLIVL